MGRPLRKDVNGVDVIGAFGTNTPSDPRAGIRVEFFDTQLRTDGVVVKQRGARTFVVSQNGNVTTHLNSTPNKSTCVLQAAQPSAAGQMRIVGYTDQGNDASAVAIRKITKRVATDFSGNRYTWFMSNFEDSTGDVIVLTPVAT
jgi:hypothetical protein